MYTTVNVVRNSNRPSLDRESVNARIYVTTQLSPCALACHWPCCLLVSVSLSVIDWRWFSAIIKKRLTGVTWRRYYTSRGVRYVIAQWSVALLSLAREQAEGDCRLQRSAVYKLPVKSLTQKCPDVGDENTPASCVKKVEGGAVFRQRSVNFWLQNYR